MMFCPKCGTLLVPVMKEEKIILKCSKCGYETEKAVKSTRKITQEKEKVIVIDREKEMIKALPTIKTECDRCGHKEAEYWMVQTRGADEGTTQFFRCTKCKHTWREMS
jgi:DNA-directed RNA polymerase subunit M